MATVASLTRWHAVHQSINTLRKTSPFPLWLRRPRNISVFLLETCLQKPPMLFLSSPLCSNAPLFLQVTKGFGVRFLNPVRTGNCLPYKQKVDCSKADFCRTNSPCKTCCNSPCKTCCNCRWDPFVFDFFCKALYLKLIDVSVIIFSNQMSISFQ